MKKIIISQRFEKIGKFKELRDNLDTRLTNLILKLGFLPILLPSNSRNVLRYINEIKNIFISSGFDVKDESKFWFRTKYKMNLFLKIILKLIHPRYFLSNFIVIRKQKKIIKSL